MDKSPLTAQQTFLPDMCRPANVLYLTLIAQLLAITLALNTSFITGSFWTALSLNALFILWVALTCAALFCLFKQRVNNAPALHISLFMFLTINLVTLLMTWLTVSLLPQLGLLHTAVEGSINIYLRNTGISSIFSSILLRFLYIQFQWRKQTHAEGEARLDALQARIRPHFLFNSLNTIASLTRINPPLAESLTEDLAELFRANMQSSQRLIPFKQEIAFTQQYLNIEQMRLGKRLTVEIEITSIPDDALIPPLSLQPIIENAVYHGIEPSEHGGVISLVGTMQKNTISILIKNPIDQNNSNDRTGNSIAVENIRLRMENCFPDESTLTISSSELQFQTQLKFPYQGNPS